MIEAFILLIVAYVLGSIPFGYLITKYTTNKNLLEIGWKKNSGSNVFKNVGLWQGVFTFIFDVLKGYLA
ncbi:MAG: glycerol-3-phosphate acyltransferase, partial [Candidatus Pacearchaeota archaeon]